MPSRTELKIQVAHLTKERDALAGSVKFAQGQVEGLNTLRRDLQKELQDLKIDWERFRALPAACGSL